MAEPSHPIPQLLWEDFLRWVMAPELATITDQGITQDILFSLYKPTITRDIFWGRLGDLMVAYRALPNGLGRLASELFRLSLSSTYRLPEEDLSPGNISPRYAKFLADINWYQDVENLDDEFTTASTLIGMGQVWYQLFVEDEHPVSERSLAVSLMLWSRMRIAVAEKDSDLIRTGKPNINPAPGLDELYG